MERVTIGHFVTPSCCHEVCCTVVMHCTVVRDVLPLNKLYLLILHKVCGTVVMHCTVVGDVLPLNKLHLTTENELTKRLGMGWSF